MPTTRTCLVDDLAELVDGQARAATDDDHVGGVRAQLVAAPGSTAQAGALLGAAAREGLTLVVRGQGTALHWGAPPRTLDLIVDTRRLGDVVEHVAGDLVCVVQAGATLDAVNARLGEHGQQLALDQPRPGASIGGTLATGRSGARRVHYGSVRDLVLGVTVVRADGVRARAGGKVVKNVAGYDLAKLVTGAYGTLGLVTEAVFRLHPLPPARRWLSVSCADAADAVARAHAVTASQLAPTAVEIRRAPGSSPVQVLVLLEGTEHGVDERTAPAVGLLGSGAQELAPGDAPSPALPGGPDDVLVRVAVPLTGIGELLRTVATAESAHGVPLTVTGSAGVGVLHLLCPADADADAVAAVVSDVRATCTGGSAVVLQAPAAVRQRIDQWGPIAGLDLMRRVKDQFDIDHRLAPGRFVGGI